MSGNDPTLDEIVRRARSLGPDDQLNYLREACGSDPALFSAALSTMNASVRQCWWDESGDLVDSNDALRGDEIIGTLIGAYRVLGVLGAGGMGQVVLAERADDEFRRKVAIKLVRSGLLSKQLQVRLRIERQILAELNHPNIARLLDGGTTADGTPYIVMEHIAGEPVDTYCNKHQLTIAERLNLFRTICSAVHYAHQNLIVHRDLKPSNILVTEDGTPKLLDFGIAKLLDTRQLTHTVAVTHFDSRLMTPDHASPEQVRGELITTASDTYVLGVLLYELLTGRKPFILERTRLSDIERAICEEPPLPLLHGLNRDGRLPDDFLEQICIERRTTPGRLRKDLRGDLQNIVSMALRKEPNRRYASVEQLSTDVDRYLRGLPVLAQSDTWGYRTRKFVARHAVASGAALAAVVALTGFTATTFVQAKRIASERAQAEEVSMFLTNLFEEATPERAKGREVTVHDILNTATARLRYELRDRPEIQARLFGTLGTVYGNLGKLPESEEMLRTSLDLSRLAHGDNSAESGAAMLRLGDLLVRKGEEQEAEITLSAALALHRTAFGNESVEAANSLRALGILRKSQEKFAESDQLFAQSTEILERRVPSNRLLLATTLNEWALLRSYRSDYAGAESLYKRALQLTEAQFGPDHPNVAAATHNLAVALDGQGKIDSARPLYEKSVAIYRKIYGDEHPETARAFANFGRFLQKQRSYAEAETALRRAVELQTKIYGSDDTNTGYSRVNLALLLLETERPEAARDELQEALRIYARELPADHQYIGAALVGLARALIELEAPREAREALDRARAIASRTYSKGSPPLASIDAARGGALVAEGRLKEAEPLLREAYPVLLSVRGSEDMFTRRVRTWINSMYERMGQPKRAKEYFESLPGEKASGDKG